MKTTWIFSNCDREQQRAKTCWEKKSRRIERQLSDYRSELRDIRLTLYRHLSPDEWELRVVLHLSTATLVAEARCPSLEEAIDQAAERLLGKLQSLKKRERKAHLARKRQRRREQMAATEPYLANDSSALRSDAFRGLLLPYMDQVYRQAKRELGLLERAGEIPKGEWTARDVVHEVLIRACETFDQRPQDSPLDVWLLQLSNQCLEGLTEQAKPVSMLAAPPIRSAPGDDDGNDLDDFQYWLRHFTEPVHDVSLEELLSDDNLSDVEERLSQAEQRERVEEILREFPKHQRQALVLHHAYGFDLDEVAVALDRSPADVEADLANGRRKLLSVFTGSTV